MQLDVFKTNGSSPPERLPDFQLICQSTIFLLEPLTDAACAWADEHLPTDVTRFGPAIVVEHRRIVDILTNICTAGLAVEWV